jgi:hypothetical protein
MATYAAFFHFPCEAHDSGYNNSSHTPSTPPIRDASNTLPVQSNQLSIPHTATGITSPQNTSPFFRFPAELRNLIYKKLLCPNTISPKDLATSTHNLDVRRFTKTSTKTHLYPAILSTCRKIYEEAHRMLYTPHTFYAHSTLLTSMPHLSSSSKPVLYAHLTALITRWHICLRLDTDPRFTSAQATAAFSGAEFLEVRVWQAQFEACDNAVLKLFTGVRGVQVARVGGSVDVKVAGLLEDLMMGPVEMQGRECCGCEVDEWGKKREVLCGRCYRTLKVE